MTLGREIVANTGGDSLSEYTELIAAFGEQSAVQRAKEPRSSSRGD